MADASKSVKQYIISTITNYFIFLYVSILNIIQTFPI